LGGLYAIKKREQAHIPKANSKSVVSRCPVSNPNEKRTVNRTVNRLTKANIQKRIEELEIENKHPYSPAQS